MLTGGLRPPETILGPLGSFGGVIPVVLTAHDTYDTVSLASAREGAITRAAPRKIDQGARAVRDATWTATSCSTGSTSPTRRRSRR